MTLTSLAFGNKVWDEGIYDLKSCSALRSNSCVAVGITGEGVVVVLLDDGLDYESDDLKDNFVSDRHLLNVYMGKAAQVYSSIARCFSLQKVHTTLMIIQTYLNQD